MTNSCRKGKVGEREAVNMLRSLGYTDAHRTQQHDGMGLSDVTIPGFDLHIEVKYGYPKKDFSLGSQLWEKAVNQAEKDSKGQNWVVLWREKRCVVWKMTFLQGPGVVTVAGDAAIQSWL